MRLLHTHTLKLEEFTGSVPKYAILSHRWEQDEVSYQDLLYGHASAHRGWLKIVNCCQVVRNAGIKYVWIDTCCIDKHSSSELNEAINSMYAYYKSSFRCYAYLNDVHKSVNSASEDQIYEDVSASQWFTRGWTLQELIAPHDLVFYNSNWEYLWAKRAYSRQLHRITRISKKLLEGRSTLNDFSVAQRLAWAAARTTTRIEDEAYCLLGLFQINMPLLYGEGRNAFFRLQEVIISKFDDQSLFGWHDDQEDVRSVLAPSVACFLGLDDLRCIYATNDGRYGHALINSNLSIRLMLIPWAMDIFVAPLSCGKSLPGSQLDDEQVTRRYRRRGIFLRKTKHCDHFIRTCVRIDGTLTDSIMLDSDVVAEKRKHFRISDRQIFIRQLLINLPDDTLHSFSFSFNHPNLFGGGRLPAPGSEVKNGFFRLTHSRSHDGFVSEDYSHYDSVMFEISTPTTRKRPCFLYLGYDLNFTPVCLILTKTLNDVEDDFGASEFSEMYRPTRPCVPLPRLLSMMDVPDHSATLLAFRALPGKSSVAHCKEFSLGIEFELKNIRQGMFDRETKGKAWHIIFKYMASIHDESPATLRRLASAPQPTLGRPLESTVKRGRLSVSLSKLFSPRAPKSRGELNEGRERQVLEWMAGEPTDFSATSIDSGFEESSIANSTRHSRELRRPFSFLDPRDRPTEASAYHQSFKSTPDEIYEAPTSQRAEIHHEIDTHPTMHSMSISGHPMYPRDSADSLLDAVDTQYVPQTTGSPRLDSYAKHIFSYELPGRTSDERLSHALNDLSRDVLGDRTDTRKPESRLAQDGNASSLAEENKISPVPQHLRQSQTPIVRRAIPAGKSPSGMSLCDNETTSGGAVAARIVDFQDWTMPFGI